MKIGIMGGTFDPIHFGHLVLAESLREDLGLDEIIFVPTGRSEYKDYSKVSSGELRYKMIKKAIKQNDFFKVSRTEIDRESYSYTCDTMREFSEMYKGDDLFFMSGADIVFGLESWKNSDWLFENVNFVIAMRPGVDSEKVKKKADELIKDRGASIRLETVPLMDISSSAIRERRSLGKSIRYLSPRAVIKIIEKHELYNSLASFDYDAALKTLKASLSQKRLKHSYGVSEAAVILAKRYGVDEKKARIAGLFHDFAKEYSAEESLKILEEMDVKDKMLLADPNLAHGMIGAHVLNRDYGLLDPDVLSAMSLHTFGAKNMGTLDKLIMMADMTEVNRVYEGVERYRELAKIDLDLACMVALRDKLSLLSKNNKKIYGASVDMYNEGLHILKAYDKNKADK